MKDEDEEEKSGPGDCHTWEHLSPAASFLLSHPDVCLPAAEEKGDGDDAPAAEDDEGEEEEEEEEKDEEEVPTADEVRKFLNLILQQKKQLNIL